MPVTGSIGWISIGAGLLATVFVVGTMFVALAIGWFVFLKRGLAVRDTDFAEHTWYSRETAVLLAELAPLILALEEREQSLELELLRADASKAREVREAMSSAETREVWSAFARASALVEEDPKRATEQLRRLRPRLQKRVKALDGLLNKRSVSRMLVERGEGDGRA